MRSFLFSLLLFSYAIASAGPSFGDGAAGGVVSMAVHKEAYSSEKGEGAVVDGSGILYHWVQFEKGNRLVARAVLRPNSPCPSVFIDGVSTHMKERKITHYRKNFPIRMCQVSFTSGARKIVFPDETSILIPRATESIGIIGDSGCRGGLQDCHDSQVYTAPRTSQALEKHKEVDLMVHVGDITYNHRVLAKPLTSRAQVDYPIGDKWEVAEFEFFKPFKDLLNSKPFLIARGNHDGCTRGGAIWSVLFDTETEHATKCRHTVPTYFVDVVDTRFIMLDSNGMSDVEAPKLCEHVDEFHNNMKLVNKYAKESDKENMIVTHRPFASVVSTGYTKNADSKVSACGFAGGGSTLRSFMLDNNTAGESISIVLSGHHHNGELLSFSESELPLQIIVGNSGAELRELLYDSPREVVGCLIYSGSGVFHKLSNFYYSNKYGFALLERASRGSKKITYYDPDGKEIDRCDINGRQFRCN